MKSRFKLWHATLPVLDSAMHNRFSMQGSQTMSPTCQQPSGMTYDAGIDSAMPAGEYLFKVDGMRRIIEEEEPARSASAKQLKSCLHCLHWALLLSPCLRLPAARYMKLKVCQVLSYLTT